MAGAGNLRGPRGVGRGMTDDWERAFDAFVRSSSPSLLRTAFLLTGDRGHAEDVLQTAFVRMARRFDPADPMPTAYAPKLTNAPCATENSRLKPRRRLYELATAANSSTWVRTPSQ